MSLQLTIEYPESLPNTLGSTRTQFEQEAKWAMAVKLFELRRLSSDMAASLLGVGQVTFLLKLADYGVPMIDLTEEEPHCRRSLPSKTPSLPQLFKTMPL